MTTFLPTDLGFAPPRLQTDSPKNTLATVFSTLFLASILFSIGCDATNSGESTSGTNPTGMDLGTVTLVIDFGPARRSPITVDVPCSEHSTVFDILDRAQLIGDIKFESSGSGDTVFVKSIATVANEGSGGNNWIYLVNEETADKSAGIYEVKPSDEIRWRFGPPPPELTEE
jgi:hypothetical protein